MSDIKRKVNLVSVVDGNVYSFADDGTSKAGDPSASRQVLMQALAKSREYNGKQLKLYKLQEAPKVLDQEFDRMYLQHDGEWLMPTPAWSEVQAKNVAERNGKQAESEMRAEAQVAAMTQTAGIAATKKALGAR
jgi:hypothetical protein